MKSFLTLDDRYHIPSAEYSGSIHNNYAVPYKHASSGIQTRALSERLIEFDARSNQLGHHGRFGKRLIIVEIKTW